MQEQLHQNHHFVQGTEVFLGDVLLGLTGRVGTDASLDATVDRVHASVQIDGPGIHVGTTPRETLLVELRVLVVDVLFHALREEKAIISNGGSVHDGDSVLGVASGVGHVDGVYAQIELIVLKLSGPLLLVSVERFEPSFKHRLLRYECLPARALEMGRQIPAEGGFPNTNVAIHTKHASFVDFVVSPRERSGRSR